MLQRSKIRLGFVCAFALLAGMATATFWASANSTEQERWVEHTQEVQRGLERVQALLADVETGSRGFVITGNPAFLSHYDEAQTLLAGELDRIGGLTRDSARQQQALVGLRQAVAEKLGHSRRTVELRAADAPGPLDHTAAALEVQSQRGRVAMEHARALVQDMNTHEDALLVLRRAAAATSARLAMASLIGGSLLQVALLAWVFRVMAAESAMQARIAGVLAASEERFRSLVASADAGIVTVDGKGCILSWNPAAERIFGLSQAEAFGRSLTIIIPERMRAAHERGFAAAAASGKGKLLGSTVELAGLRHDGSEVPISLSLATWTSGGERFFSGIILDISARKRAEEDRSRLASMLESTSDFVGLADPHGSVIYLNAAFRRMRSLPLQSDLGDMHIRDTLPAWAFEMVQRDALPTAARDGSWSGETALTGPDGGEVPVSQLVICNKNADGSVAYYFTIMRDISERKRIEADLRTARDEAEAGAKAKSEFLATMSHEIRTPMNGVIGMTGLLLDTRLSPEQRGMVDTVRSCADSLMTIINDVLDLSKIEAGRLEIERIPYEPRRVADDAAAVLAQKARSKGLELAVRIAPEVPTMVVGDPGRLRQVLVNLIGNAVKFTDAGRIEVRIAAERLDDAVALDVAVNDTGIGISADDQARLFQSFIQADASTTRRYGGTGLGLAICRRLVGLMGGDIAVDSAPGRGSTFRFRIRVAPVDGAVAEALLPEAPRRLAGRVLVAEDNLVNQRVTLALLAKLGCNAVVVASGEEALALLARSPCDLVLMDCQMPGLDGYETTRAWRRQEAAADAGRLPVVAMTANALAGDRERCLMAGMDDYLTKPVRLEELARVLGRWLPTTAEPAPPERAEPSPAGDGPTTIAGLLAALARASAAGDDAGIRRLAIDLRGAARRQGDTALAAHCTHLELLPAGRLADEAPALVRTMIAAAEGGPPRAGSAAPAG